MRNQGSCTRPSSTVRRSENRRLLIMSTADHKTLMKSREAILADFRDRKVDRAVKEMNRICTTHHDYMWDVLIQTP